MQSQSSPPSHQVSDQELIQLVTSKNNEATLEALFVTQADSFFNLESKKALISYTRQTYQPQTAELLERLGDQYIADKIRLHEWDKALTYYVTMATYYLELRQAAKVIYSLERAIFYLSKCNKPNFAKRKLFLQNKLLSFYIENFKQIKINYIDPEESCCVNLLKALHNLQRLLAVAYFITFQNPRPTDFEFIQSYYVIYKIINEKLANYYIDEAEVLLDETNELDDDQDTIPGYNFVIIKYQYALYYLAEARIIYLRLPASAELLEATTKLDTTVETIEAAYTTILSDPTIEARFGSYSEKYQILQLCALVANRNTEVTTLHNFLIENRVDVNLLSNINQASGGEIFYYQEPSPLEFAVSTGSIAIVKCLIQLYHVQVNLFPNQLNLGLLHHVNDLTMPEVVEYLMDTSQPFHQNHPQRYLIHFFIDCMAGRLTDIQRMIAVNPDIITHIIANDLAEEVPIGYFALHAAYKGKQKHVIAYLEAHIAQYFLANNSIERALQLTALYFRIINCYETFGWNEQRREFIKTLAQQLTTCFTKFLNYLINILPQHFTETHRLQLATAEHQNLLILSSIETKKIIAEEKNYDFLYDMDDEAVTMQDSGDVAESVVSQLAGHTQGSFSTSSNLFLSNQKFSDADEKLQPHSNDVTMAYH